MNANGLFFTDHAPRTRNTVINGGEHRKLPFPKKRLATEIGFLLLQEQMATVHMP